MVEALRRSATTKSFEAISEHQGADIPERAILYNERRRNGRGHRGRTFGNCCPSRKMNLALALTDLAVSVVNVTAHV